MIALAAAAVATLIGLGATLRPPAMPAALVAVLSESRRAQEPAVYRAQEREVSNWREATRWTLEPAPLAAAAGFLLSGRPVVTRCVKLNNPWCIKRARWPGEIGADDEGHTAFATTEAGADAAATLLRTYAVSYGLRSAADIVRRWAPAECRLGDGAGLPAVLAVRGLANTLRARFLVSTRTGTAQPRAGRAVRAGGAPRPPAGRVRVSVVPLPRMPTFRVPDLAPGLGERVVRAAPKSRRAAAGAKPAVRLAVLRIAALGTIPAPPPASLCGSEEGRIAVYSAAIARALGVSPSDDLKLFDGEGRPTANLLPVMVAMSAIELGYLHAGPELAEGAVGRLRDRLAAQAASNGLAPGE